MAEKDRMLPRAEEVYPMPCHGDVGRLGVRVAPALEPAGAHDGCRKLRIVRSTLARCAGFAALEQMPPLFGDETRCPVLDPGRGAEHATSSLRRAAGGRLCRLQAAG